MSFITESVKVKNEQDKSDYRTSVKKKQTNQKQNHKHPPQHPNPPLKKANHNCIAFIFFICIILYLIHILSDTEFSLYAFQYWCIDHNELSVEKCLQILFNPLYEFQQTFWTYIIFTLENRGYYCDMGSENIEILKL